MEKLQRLQRIILLVILVISPNLYADRPKGILGIGYDSGGDTLYDFTSTQGDREEIKAHEGLYLLIGLNYKLNDNIEIQLSLGKK